ncbi:MAG TPA: alpha-E domain-containing protein [Candidatus Aquilonibacter sp.]|nr:alpha-E domain-containing protein [Candidatus Aquilonibacter sp.]
MLSRVADSLYWVGRYLERAENTVRILDVNLSLMLEGSHMDAESRWRRVMRALGHPQNIDPGDIDATVRRLIFDTADRASVATCIASARENARQVRDEISSEQWQKLNRLFHALSDMERFPMLSDATQAIIEGIHLFQGVTDTTMPHGEGWHFIRIGRYMERASQIAMLLETHYRELFAEDDSLEHHSQYLEWIGLLRCCTSFEAYCTVYTADLTPERILEFLLLNREFPHTLWYSVNALVEALTGVEQGSHRAAAEALTRAAGKLRASLSFMEIREILAGDPAEYLRNMLNQCRAIQELIYRLYISYSVDTALTM